MKIGTLARIVCDHDVVPYTSVNGYDFTGVRFQPGDIVIVLDLVASFGDDSRRNRARVLGSRCVGWIFRDEIKAVVMP